MIENADGARARQISSGRHQKSTVKINSLNLNRETVKELILNDGFPLKWVKAIRTSHERRRTS